MRGLGHINLFPTGPEYHRPETQEEENEAIQKALEEDWKNVGKDLEKAMKQVEREQNLEWGKDQNGNHVLRKKDE